jgi:hypothetical protein
MAIIPKSKIIQLRVEPEFFDRLTVRADANNTSVSGLIRGVMGQYLRSVEEKDRKDAEWAATLNARAASAAAAGAKGKKK